jgi:hypothetical protein
MLFQSLKRLWRSGTTRPASRHARARLRPRLEVLEDRLCPSAPPPVLILGGLSNFDCTNNTGQTQNEFEIELPSVDPTRIAGFWANTPSYKGSGYGLPTEAYLPSSDGIKGHMSTYIDYKATNIATPAGFTEHFGIHFVDPTFIPPAAIYTWKFNGTAFNVPLPSVALKTTSNGSGGVTVTPVVANDTNTPLVVQFHTAVVAPASADGVQLGDLVDTNAEVQLTETETEAGDNGRAGVRLDPGQVLGVDGEAHDPTDPIIVNPALWLQTHPGQGISFGMDLNAGGDSALTTLVVTDVAGNPISQVFSAVNTAPPPRVTTNPSSQTVNVGHQATFSASASSPTKETVQWQVSSDNGQHFRNVLGATAPSLRVTAAARMDGYEYRAVFTNRGGSTATSAATLTVDHAPQLTGSPQNQTVAIGSIVAFRAAALSEPTAAVKWQVSTDRGKTFQDIAGATSATLSFTAELGDSGKLYRAVFANGLGSVTSAAARLTVDIPPAVTTNPSSQTVNAGQAVTFTASASGSPQDTVQWQVSSDGGRHFRTIKGATATSLRVTATAGMNGYQYRASFTNPVGFADTSAATLTVDFAPVLTASPQSQTIAVGSTVTFRAAALSEPTAAVQWQVSTDRGKTFQDVSGATSATLSFTAQLADSGKLYRAVFTNGLGSVTSAAARLTVDIPPKVLTDPSSVSVQTGHTVTLTASASGTPACLVQWQVSTDGGNHFSTIRGATSDKLLLLASLKENGYQYRAVFSNPVGQATSKVATLTVTA